VQESKGKNSRAGKENIMGLFNLFTGRGKNKKRNIVEESTSDINKEMKRSARLTTLTERAAYIKDNCEQIIESGRQIEEAKAEYQAVTSYLTDMQKIDMIPIEQRGNMEDAARNILNLTKERNKLQNRSSILTDKQYRLFEQYELQIPKEIPLIRDAERYQTVIDQDISHLDKERQSLDDEQEEIISKQAFLKGIAVTTSVIIVFLFLLFILIGNYTKADFTIPFLLTVLMWMISAFYIFMEARKNIASVHLVQQKQNRQIQLMNKVKIKTINNRNFIEYSYNKYNTKQ
jgi:hypothetical protein